MRPLSQIRHACDTRTHFHQISNIKRTHGGRAHAHTQKRHADTETDRQAGRQREAERERERKRELRNGRESEGERPLSCGEVEITSASRGLSGVKCASACAFMNLNTGVQSGST